jgi:hypothetical protein
VGDRGTLSIVSNAFGGYHSPYTPKTSSVLHLYSRREKLQLYRHEGCLKVFNATFNNNSVISWFFFSANQMSLIWLTLPVVVIVVIVWELDLQLPMQVVPITTDVVSSNFYRGEVYIIHNL